MRITIIESDPIENDCFVIMPFQAEFESIYKNVLAPAIEEAGLRPLKANEVYGARSVMDDVWNGIKRARVVLAELTGRNANVLYELGLAHAIGKAVIIITSLEEDVPFDLRHIRYIRYDYSNPRWRKDLHRRIVLAIKRELNEGKTSPLLGGIQVTVEDSEAPVAPAVDKKPQAGVDISGEWESFEIWPDPPLNSRRTKMRLEQIGAQLSGTAETVGPNPDDPDWIVEQRLTGHVIEHQLQLVATSVKILKSPGSMVWNPENWHGTIETQDLISGEIGDKDNSSRGSFTMRRLEDNHHT